MFKIILVKHSVYYIALFLVVITFIITNVNAAESAIVIQNLDPPGTFKIINTTNKSVHLLREHNIEVLIKNKWVAIQLQTPYLTDFCEPPTQQNHCITIEGKSTITPPKWTGWTCSDRCVRGCSADTNYGLGPYRVVIKSCDGQQNFIGKQFYMPNLDS